jgi:hypothetical protein
MSKPVTLCCDFRFFIVLIRALTPYAVTQEDR